MKKPIYVSALAATVFFLSTNILSAQGVAINNDGSQAAASAMLDVKATDKGMLVPRVTATSAVGSPAQGLLVYQTGGAAGFYYYNGTAWVYLKNSATPETGTASGQVLVTGATPHNATLQTMSGDATIAANGAITIANNAVTVAKMATSGTLPAFNGSALTNLNASNLGSGTVPVARLGSGTPSATTFLNGAGAWTTAPVGNMQVTTVGSNNVTLSNQNQLVYVNANNIVVVLPANPENGQTIHFISDFNHLGINPNGKSFRQANVNYPMTSYLDEFGSSTTKTLTLIYSGTYWLPLL